METLQIVPVNFEREGLEQIAANTIRAFPTIFRDFIIFPQRDYKDMIHPDVREVWEGQPADGMMAFLTLCQMGGYVLAITGLPMVDDLDGVYYCYGHGSSEGQAAIVSTYKPEISQASTPNLIRRASTVAIHEIGHVFGLEHHLGDEPQLTSSGKVCPIDISMIKDRDLVSRFKLQDWIRYLDRRDLVLCQRCQDLSSASYRS